MTDGAWDIVGRKDQELPIGTTLGNALRELIARRFRNNAAKRIETLWDLDPKTAKNVVQRGNVSERTLTKAALAERWTLWMALGEELFGQSYAEWEEQRLKRIIEEAQHELGKVRRLRAMDSHAAEAALDPSSTDVLDSYFAPEPAHRGERSSSQTGAR